MDKQQTLTLMTMIRATYPNFYNKSDEQNIELAANVWWAALNNLEYERVKKAFIGVVRTLKFPPVPADIIEAYNKELCEERFAARRALFSARGQKVPVFKRG